ncbi:SUR7/PalI family domain containing protein [Hyaloscypha variabilis]|uniref:SUR7-domain-containing protein n=1 Tax=Hyaloscypha variabilis (strain UAMH 11265 / GT02V1 / F) TaxID=1149755 RepID=A0A2J6RLE1_HYAVF|nr:hypothetical protein L207DRAFT_513793 [Hyaloscypha variabilis F]
MGIVSLILIAGAIVLQFFVVLSGVTNTTPLNKTYFLQADTSTIAGSGRAVSQWTYFYVCGAGNQDCGKPVPDLPFGYAWVGGSAGVPDALTGSHGKGTTSTYYYYMWRFGWVFYLIGLALTVFAFFTSLLAPCSRLASGISGFITMFALFWFTLAAALMTTVFVKARDRFRDAGLSANIGRYAFGFTWGAWAAMFLATIFLFMGCGAGGRRSDDHVRGSGTRGGSTRFFRRQRSRRSARGSFVDTESQRRVKDEYA